ncbi:MAG: DUF4136 domain-containing protein [Bacteroidota bacterium]
MRNIFIPIWILAVVLLNGCGSSMRVYYDLDDATSFEQYATYSFMDFTDGNKETITGMELERIRVAIARELEQRGLQFVEENGDVSVKITVYHREAMDRYYGYRWRYNFMERAIAVDMYDNQARKHVWHCAAVDELDYDPEERAAKLHEVASEIFERYPVQPAREI